MYTFVENLAALLQERDIKPSYPRIKVLEYLVTKKNHPTVDLMYQELVKEMPTLSKTTVYNTLSLLLKASLVRVINIEDNETRYDATMSDHGHFKCETCGKIFDFPVNMLGLDPKSLERFKICEKKCLL